MERPEDRKMLYKFFSHKNNRNMYVHSRIPMRVSNEDLATEWTTDFVITHVDGHRIVKEIVPKKYMADVSYLIRLEMSRRYWALDDDGTQWMIVSVDD